MTDETTLGHIDMCYKQACIDLEKATQVITQALQVRHKHLYFVGHLLDMCGNVEF